MQALTPTPHFLRTLACSALLVVLAPSASAAISCSPNPSNTINLGSTIDVLAGAPAPITGTVNLSCKHSGLGRVARACLHFGRGSASAANGGAYTPRLLADANGTGTNIAGFNIAHNGSSTGDIGTDPSSPTTGVWGTYHDALGPATPYVSLEHTYSAIGFTMNLQIPFSVGLASIDGSNPISSFTPGSYKSTISSSTHATLEIPVVTVGTAIDNRCQIPGWAIQYGNMNVPITFEVTATIIPACKITNDGSIGDLDFGSASTHAAPSVPNPSTTLSVQCTRTTPYAIGLLPSNNNANGAGTMSAGGNPDTVPYQLRKGPGASAAVWGNTGTDRISGSGTGVAVNHIVYGTVAGTNYRGGNYTDTVTVTVNY